MGQTELPRRKTLFSRRKSFCETGIVNRSVVPLKDSVMTAQMRGLSQQGCLTPLYNLNLNFSNGEKSTKVIMEPPTLRRSCHFSNAGCHQDCPHKPFSCQNTFSHPHTTQCLSSSRGLRRHGLLKSRMVFGFRSTSVRILM